MRLGVLFSGGKDSTLALHLAAEKEEVACLITVVSKNKESYMFHTPNIDVTALQAEALGLPLVSVVTEGRKEEELADLEKAIAEAKSKFHIDGIVTGAVESVYQASRVQRICNRPWMSGALTRYGSMTKKHFWKRWLKNSLKWLFRGFLLIRLMRNGLENKSTHN